MNQKNPVESPYVLEGARANFAIVALENSERGPVLINYWSPQAGPCLRLYPVLDKLIHEFQGKILLINVNTDEQAQLARDYGVNSLPTLKLMIRRQVVETIHGYQPETELRRVLNKYIAQKSDESLSDALQIYRSGDKERALALLAQAAIDDSQNLRIPLTLAKLLMREDRHADAYELLLALPAQAQEDPELRDLLVHLGFLLAAREAPDKDTLEAKIAADPDDLEARYQLCAVKLVDDDYRAAMDLLLGIMRKDSRFRDGVARKGLLALFGMLKHEPELVAHYRKEMMRFVH